MDHKQKTRMPWRNAVRKRISIPAAAAILTLLLPAGVTEAVNLFRLLNPQKDLTAQMDERLLDLPKLPAFGKEDRILILAPHPDDEILGTGGLIQIAREAGASVKIVFLTNGDHDQIAFKIDTGRFLMTPQTYIKMGEKRRGESLAAAQYLGLKKEDLVFLGYPDFGTLGIWKERWGNAPAARSGLTRANAVPYRDDLSFQAPYKGESILADLTKILKEYRPTAAFVTVPADTNPDHQAAYCFLSAAILNAAKSKDPENENPGFTPPNVYLYLIHLGLWPRPFHYHPESPLLPPEKLTGGEFRWLKLMLSPAETEKKYQAILLFKTVLKGRAYLWTAFARQNELFAVMPELKMQKTTSPNHTPDWNKALEVKDIGVGEYEYESELEPEFEANLRGVYYLKTEDRLLVRIFLKKSLMVKTGISLYLFGFRKDVPFGEMPKIRLTASTLATMFIYDGLQKIGELPVTLSQDKTELIVEIPLSLLNKPESVFTSLRVHRNDLSLDSTAWHLLIL